MGHVHVHAPHELTESHEEGEHDATPRFERRLELAAVLLLSLTTLATAWSGYQAALWSGVQSQAYARSSALHAAATQNFTAGGQRRIDDQLYFNGWLNAREAGNRRLADIYRRRFRPEFRPAFTAWIAQHPFTNVHAIPGPLYMPQYKLQQNEHGAALEREASHRYELGTEAKHHDDDYILSTVFFAAVLFFAGISLRLDWRPLRIFVLGMAATMLCVGAVFVLSLPVA
jgi:hypothetical protein